MNFPQKWQSIGRLDALLAKTLLRIEFKLYFLPCVCASGVNVLGSVLIG